jgi:hypothetical protein
MDLYMTEATRLYHTIKEMALARFLARKAVKAQWRAQGRKLFDYGAKELTETGECYLREHPELLVEAKAMEGALNEKHRAVLERIAQERKR